MTWTVSSESEALRIVNEATDAVESAPYPKADDFREHVYAR